MIITSNSNAKVKKIIRLRDKSGERKKAGVFLAEGIKMFEEAPDSRIREVYVSEGALLGFENDKQVHIINKLDKHDKYIVKDDIFNKMSDTRTPQGIITVVNQPEYSVQQIIGAKDPLIVILENLQDPGNLGTIIRTGEGAGVTGIIMSSQTVDIFNPKTIRATMGSIYRVPFVYVDDVEGIVKELISKGINTYAAHLSGKNYYDSFSFDEPTAFLIGNEGNGLTKKLADCAKVYLKIPMEGKVESLNAAIAASLLMYEAHRQRTMKK